MSSRPPEPLTPDRIGAVLHALPDSCAELRTLAERVRCELHTLCTPPLLTRGDLLRDYLRLRLLWPLVRDDPAVARAGAERVAAALRETEEAPPVLPRGGLSVLGRVTEEELEALAGCRDVLAVRFG